MPSDTPTQKQVQDSERRIAASFVKGLRAGKDFPCALHRGPKGDCNANNCKC